MSSNTKDLPPTPPPRGEGRNPTPPLPLGEGVGGRGPSSSRLPPPGEPVLRIRGVNHYFGTGDTRTQVLFDNTLEVMPGELVIMSGPSGSGKTTILTLIGGLRTLQEGEIEVWDADRGDYRKLRGVSEDELVSVRKLIGFIFQRHNLFDSLTAMQNIRMAQRLKENGPADADADARTSSRTCCSAKRILRASRRSRASTTSRRPFPGGNARRSPSPARSSTGRSWSSRTNPPPPSTPTAASRS